MHVVSDKCFRVLSSGDEVPSLVIRLFPWDITPPFKPVSLTKSNPFNVTGKFYHVTIFTAILRPRLTYASVVWWSRVKQKGPVFIGRTATRATLSPWDPTLHFYKPKSRTYAAKGQDYGRGRNIRICSDSRTVITTLDQSMTISTLVWEYFEALNKLAEKN